MQASAAMQPTTLCGYKLGALDHVTAIEIKRSNAFQYHLKIIAAWNLCLPHMIMYNFDTFPLQKRHDPLSFDVRGMFL